MNSLLRLFPLLLLIACKPGSVSGNPSKAVAQAPKNQILEQEPTEGTPELPEPSETLTEAEQIVEDPTQVAPAHQLAEERAEVSVAAPAKATAPAPVPKPPIIEKPDSKNAAGPDHAPWDELLQKYVDDSGNVDYANFKANKAQLDSYLEQLGTNPPKASWTKNEKLAYYINLYNAATVRLIVDHYPIGSIKDIPNRWKKKWIVVGGETTSLNDIEHEVLRKMDEPRIHFAINCASYSCPQLINTAFTAQNMEKLLHTTTKMFIGDPKRNRFQRRNAKLSKIFKWYKSDFTENGSLLEYINPYLNTPVDPKAGIDYLEYDWSLNEKK